MTLRHKLFLAAGIVLCAGPALAASRAAFAPDATPEGITLEPLGKAAGYGLDKTTAAVVPREQIVFATPKGLTLYTSDADPVGKSVCVDECAKTWIPALVSKGAVPVENWSVITRPDGARQWAFKGKALYSFVEDKDPASVGGNSPARFYRGQYAGPRGAVSAAVPKDKPLPKGWNVAYFHPSQQQVMPAGFAVEEVEDVLGMVLVDSRKHTLYVLADAARGKACKGDACAWLPVAAPSIAEGVGEFTPVWRDDGIRQWSYKGRGLYTFAGDLAPGDANGAGVDKGWEPARVVKYFVPANVRLQDTAKLGKVFATDRGMSIYMRDAFIFQSGAGHGLRHGSPIRPAVGRDLGTNPRCKDDCLTSWHPLVAPADAQPNGNWNIYVREDGTKQWSYQGFALWTFDGDKKPGDLNGNDDYQIAMSHDDKTVVDIGTPYDGATALYWIVAHP